MPQEVSNDIRQPHQGVRKRRLRVVEDNAIHTLDDHPIELPVCNISPLPRYRIAVSTYGNQIRERVVNVN